MNASTFRTTSLYRSAVTAGSAARPAGRTAAVYRPAPLEILPASPAEAVRPPPGLAFSEAELARACAGCAAAAAGTAREEALASSATLLLERLARTLDEESERRRQSETAQRHQLVALVLAALQRILGAQAAGERARQLADLLAEQAPVEAGQTVRVEVSPDDLAALEAELARDGRPALPALLELVAAPRLAPGALSAQWPEGWLERDPACFLERLGQLLNKAASASVTFSQPAQGPSQDEQS